MRSVDLVRKLPAYKVLPSLAAIRLRLMLGVGASALHSALTPLASATTFVDVTSTAFPGIHSIPDAERPCFYGGAAIGDCDGDGHADLYLTGVEHDLFFRNRGDGTFEDATLAAGFGRRVGTRAAAFADIDNDGDLDLMVTGAFVGRYFLYINDGSCRFVDEAVDRGIPMSGSRITPESVSFGDYNRDGFLDAFLAERFIDTGEPNRPDPVGRLLRNRGAAAPGHFEDVTLATGIRLDTATGWAEGIFTFTPLFTDLDGDRWPDLALISDFHSSRLFWNEGNDRFTDGTVASGVGTDEFGMGATTADFDGDGDLDLFVTSIFVEGNPNGTGNRLYRNEGRRVFSDATDAAGVRNGKWGWGTQAFDYDNDGDLDLVMVNGQYGERDVVFNRFTQRFLAPIDPLEFLHDQPRLWRNNGVGVFADVSESSGLFNDDIALGVLTFDYDGDGDLDILVVRDAFGSIELRPADTPPILMRNDDINDNHWLAIELEGQGSHPNGVGALVTVTPAGRPPMLREVTANSTYLSQDGTARLHFGLGSAIAVESVRVDWLNGAVQTVVNPEIDRVVVITEECGVSGCPAVETATARPTATATGPPPPTPSSTAVPSSTPTPSPSPPCVCDCDENGQVTVDELVIGISVALGHLPLSACAAGDRDASGTLTIDELISGVTNALAGCG